MTRQRFNVFVLLTLAGAALASGGTITFDNALDLTGFNLNGNASTTFHFNSTAGVGSGGGVTSTSTAFSSDAAVYPNPFTSPPLGQTFFVSVDYQMQFQDTGGPDVRVGFTTTPTGNLGDANAVWIETGGNSNPKTFAHAEVGFYSFFPSVSMTPGNWYRLKLVLTRDSSSGFQESATLYDLGPTGLSNPTTVSSRTNNFGGSGFGAGVKLYPAFFLLSNTTAADNFSGTTVVPGPKPLVTNLTRVGNDLQISFTTVPAKNYQLQSSDLLSGTWISFGNIIGGNGAVQQLTATNAFTQTGVFYRVLQSP